MEVGSSLTGHLGILENTGIRAFISPGKIGSKWGFQHF